MKILPFLAAGLVFGGSISGARAQAPAAGQSGADMQVNIQSLVEGRPASLPTGSAELKGSPYAIDRWLPGHLVLASKVRLAPVPLKYDVLGQRLLMRHDFKARDSLQLNDRQVVRFTLEEPATALTPARTRTFERFSDAPEPRHRAAYAEVLHQGRYTLLKHYLKTLRKANTQSAYGDRSYDEIENQTTYYLRRPDASVVPVKLSLKGFSEAAPDLAATFRQAGPAPKTEAGWAAALTAADPR
ncbi:hypothetical protein [uncultured Hymenobacter sp.]|uniref:hypothetical protein n=1 Tax=uncultured Hymenobacter sp. TaxID=170016 RepID=UPI0035C9A35B